MSKQDLSFMSPTSQQEQSQAQSQSQCKEQSIQRLSLNRIELEALIRPVAGGFTGTGDVQGTTEGVGSSGSSSGSNSGSSSGSSSGSTATSTATDSSDIMLRTAMANHHVKVSGVGIYIYIYMLDIYGCYIVISIFVYVLSCLHRYILYRKWYINGWSCRKVSGPTYRIVFQSTQLFVYISYMS